MFWNRLGYSPLCIEETQGRAGGIWALAQNGHNFGLSTFHSNSQSVTIEVRMGTRSWYCTGVYASPTPTCRDSFWQYLIDLSTTISGAWTLIGDFNEILLPCEQKGCHFSMSISPCPQLTFSLMCSSNVAYFISTQQGENLPGTATVSGTIIWLKGLIEG